MSVVDASILVSVYHTPDAFHQRSVAWLQEHIQAGGIVVAPLLILSEVAGPIARQTNDPQQGLEAIRHLRALPSLYLVPFDEHLANHSAHLAATLRLRGADATYVALADQLGLPLITWDQEQLDRGGLAVTVLRPDAASHHPE